VFGPPPRRFEGEEHSHTLSSRKGTFLARADNT
jgi:hypothetical protein